ncbi:MAG: hypothetical protein JWP48_3496 [Actinoallomurus sp.]|jgi:hypothetical protein|nr:hypothetical protein [Actinoallomurus sp.]
MTENHDLRVLGRLATRQQHQPAEDPDHDQIQETKCHRPGSCPNPAVHPNRRSAPLRRVLERYTQQHSRSSCRGDNPRRGRSRATSGRRSPTSGASGRHDSHLHGRTFRHAQPDQPVEQRQQHLEMVPATAPIPQKKPAHRTKPSFRAGHRASALAEASHAPSGAIAGRPCPITHSPRRGPTLSIYLAQRKSPGPSGCPTPQTARLRAFVVAPYFRSSGPTHRTILQSAPNVP